MVTILLVVAHLTFSVNHEYIGWMFPGATFLYVLFDMHGEVTIPTWFSSSVLLLCALAVSGVALLTWRALDRYRYHWAGLGLIFLGLSVEESADIHGAVSHKMQNVYETGGIMTYPWVLPAAMLALVVGVLYIRFLRDLNPYTRRLFIIAGCIYLGGALGMELVEAAYESRFGADFVYLLMVTVEETVEIAGAILFLTASLLYLGTIAPRFRVEVAPE